ncbi:MAG: site-specific integrase, partial [Segetibacter sp.]
MKQSTDFAKYLSSFLNNYLITERGVSNNTVKSYSYTFIIFINYMRDVKNININKCNYSPPPSHHFTPFFLKI